MDHYRQDSAMSKMGSILYEHMDHYHQGLSLGNVYLIYLIHMIVYDLIGILSMLSVCQYELNNRGGDRRGPMN